MNKPKLVVIGGVGLGLGLVAMGALPLATSMPAEPPAVTQAPPALENVYLPRVGRLVPRTQPDPKDDTWMIGCEVLDRDFAKFSAYKDFCRSWASARSACRAAGPSARRSRGSTISPGSTSR